MTDKERREIAYEMVDLMIDRCDSLADAETIVEKVFRDAWEEVKKITSFREGE